MLGRIIIIIATDAAATPPMVWWQWLIMLLGGGSGVWALVSQLLSRQKINAEALALQSQGKVSLSQSWSIYVKELRDGLADLRGELEVSKNERRAERDKLLAVIRKQEEEIQSLRARVDHLESENKRIAAGGGS